MSEKNLFDNLSDEIKEKLKDCKSEEELTKVLADAGIELDKEMLNRLIASVTIGDRIKTDGVTSQEITVNYKFIGAM